MEEERSTQQSQEWLAAQHGLARQLLHHDTLDKVAPSFVAAIAGALRWEAGALWEVPMEGEALRFVTGWGDHSLDTTELWRISESIRFERGTGLPGRAWKRGEISWILDLESDQNFPRLPVARRLGLSGALAIPIPIGPPEGVLAVSEFFTRQFEEPSERLMSLLVGFSDQLAMFINRQRAEAALRGSVQLKSAMLGAALDCIVTIDHLGRIVEFNPAAERTFGYHREEVLGKRMDTLLMPEEFRERHRRGLKRYLETGDGPILERRLEMTAMRRDGAILPIELTVTVLTGSDPPMFTGFVRDITDRLESERTRRQLAAVVEGTQDAVLSKDLDGRITAWNPAAERLYGYSAAEAIGRNISFLVPEDRRNEEKVILERVRGGELLKTYETERIRKDGARVEVSLTVSPIESPPLGIVGASVVARDVTELRDDRSGDDAVAGTAATGTRTPRGPAH